MNWECWVQLWYLNQDLYEGKFCSMDNLPQVIHHTDLSEDASFISNKLSKHSFIYCMNSCNYNPMYNMRQSSSSINTVPEYSALYSISDMYDYERIVSHILQLLETQICNIKGINGRLRLILYLQKVSTTKVESILYWLYDYYLFHNVIQILKWLAFGNSITF